MEFLRARAAPNSTRASYIPPAYPCLCRGSHVIWASLKEKPAMEPQSHFELCAETGKYESRPAEPPATSPEPPPSSPTPTEANS